MGRRRGAEVAGRIPVRRPQLQCVPLALSREDFAEPSVLGQLRPGGVPHLPDEVTREAYSHEVISAGFWLGGGGFDQAAFYAYAYPTPEKLAQNGVEPAAARWNPQLGEFLLPYAAVQESPDPDAEVQRFLRSTFDAAAPLLDWPGGVVIGPEPAYGHPPRR